MLQDIAILTGGQVISEEVGLKLENTTMDLLGSARKVVVTKDDTTIVEGGGKDEDIQGRINQIKAEIEKTDPDYDREKLQERLAEPAGGVAGSKVRGAAAARSVDGGPVPPARGHRRGEPGEGERAGGRHARRRRHGLLIRPEVGGRGPGADAPGPRPFPSRNRNIRP